MTRHRNTQPDRTDVDRVFTGAPPKLTIPGQLRDAVRDGIITPQHAQTLAPYLRKTNTAGVDPVARTIGKVFALITFTVLAMFALTALAAAIAWLARTIIGG